MSDLRRIECDDCDTQAACYTEQEPIGLCWVCAVKRAQVDGGASEAETLAFVRGFVKATLAAGEAHLLILTLRPDWAYQLSRSMAPDRKAMPIDGLN